MPAEGACDDGDECTLDDFCDEGYCAGGSLDIANPQCVCCTEVGCAEDDDLCDGTIACNPVSCLCEFDPATIVDCPDHENQCKSYTCQPNTGECLEEALPDDTACDDGEVCTKDDACEAGTCKPGETDLENPDCATCCDVGCANDDNLCNGAMECDMDTCVCELVPDSVVECEPHDNPCMYNDCDPATGECLADAKPEGAGCDDDNPCTDGDSCAAGACVPGGPLDCGDDDPCTDDSCDPDTGCVNAPNSSAACEDGNPCTSGDTCGAGICVAGPPTVCDDDNPCTYDFCDENQGCVSLNSNDALCEDGDLCNGIETCLDGDCLPGVPLVCADENPCTDESCDPTVGCQYTPDDNNDCLDQDACNGAETCVNGECIPAANLDCDDQNPCTDDSCEAAVGCINTPDNNNVCADDDLCNGTENCIAGTCTPGAALNCDDEDPCTDDSCDQQNGCLNSTSADGTPCPGGDSWTCLSGACVCQPECDGKDCGDNGCGGVCGDCTGDKNCVNGLCEDPYSCSDILQCSLACNFTMECISQCYGNASDGSKQLFNMYALCLAGECGLVINPMCYMAASQGACASQATACLND